MATTGKRLILVGLAVMVLVSGTLAATTDRAAAGPGRPHAGWAVVH